MDNIFVEGKEVSGKNLIGYERYVKDLKKIILKGKSGISIRGIKKYGKTSLVKEVLSLVKEESKENIISLFLNLSKYESFSDFLEAIIDELDDLPKTTGIWEKTDKYIKRRDDFYNISGSRKRNKFESIFKWLKQQNYRVILTIDEFDSASKFFADSDFAFIRDLSAVKEIDITLILISRRKVNMIENKNTNNSNLVGVLESFPIQGFNQEDFDLLYEILEKKYQIKLEVYQKEQLISYCGRSPYLLSMFAKELVDEFNRIKTINIDAILKKRQEEINSYYAAIKNCLDNDNIMVHNKITEISTSEKLVGIIFGPQISIGKEDINILEQLGYLYSDGEKYVAISELFTQFLQREIRQVDIWQSILDLEKKIKIMIRNQTKKQEKLEYIDYDVWLKLFEDIGVKEKLIDTYDRFVETTMQRYHKHVDFLNVCSFQIAVQILENCWQNYKSYFDDDDWSEWGKKLEHCYKARNPIAHGQKDFLTAKEISAVNYHCEEIKGILDKNNACLDIEVAIKQEHNIKKMKAEYMYYQQDYAHVDENLKHKKVTMTAAAQNSKSIKGFFMYNNKTYKCSILNEKWKEKFQNNGLSGHLGKNFDIKIVNIKRNYVVVEFV